MRRQSLLGSTLFNSSAQVVNIVIALAVSPFTVHHIGLRAFGYWSVLLAIVQYVQIANGSFPTVTTRLAALALAEDNVAELRAVVATTTITLSVIAALVTAASVGLPLVVPHSVSASFPPGWHGAATWCGISVALTMMATGLGGVTRGAHRWDLDAANFSVAAIGGAVATVVLLLNGFGLRGLGMASAAGSAILLVNYAIIAVRYGAIGRAGFRPRRKIFKELRQQGAALQIVGIVGVTNAQSDRLMLLPFASLSFIGAYSLGSRVAVALRAFPLSAFGPLMARAAAAEKEGREAVRILYERALRLVADYALPLLLGAYFAMYPAVLGWLGGTFKVSAAGAVLLGVGYAGNVITGPGTSIAIACGKAELDRDYNLLGLALNLVLSAILGLLIGPWGVIGATTLGLLLSSVWLLWRADAFLMTRISSQVLTQLRFVTTIVGVIVIGAATIASTTLVARHDRLEYVGLAFMSGFVQLLWVSRGRIRGIVGWLAHRKPIETSSV